MGLQSSVYLLHTYDIREVAFHLEWLPVYDGQGWPRARPKPRIRMFAGWVAQMCLHRTFLAEVLHCRYYQLSNTQLVPLMQTCGLWRSSRILSA